MFGYIWYFFLLIFISEIWVFFKTYRLQSTKIYEPMFRITRHREIFSFSSISLRMVNVVCQNGSLFTWIAFTLENSRFGTSYHCFVITLVKSQWLPISALYWISPKSFWFYDRWHPENTNARFMTSSDGSGRLLFKEKNNTQFPSQIRYINDVFTV